VNFWLLTSDSAGLQGVSPATMEKLLAIDPEMAMQVHLLMHH
jgi:hypothetical protein